MSEQSYKNFWGIDISKDWVDISINNKVERVMQTSKELKAFIKKQRVKEPTLVVLESTGGYERLAVRCLTQAGLTVHVAHPSRVRDYAKARNRTAKTDQLDARILEGYGRFIDPASIQAVPTEQAYRLKALGSHLSQLKESTHREKCRLNMATDKVVIRSLKKLIKVLTEQSDKIEEELASLIEADETLKVTYKRLQTMQGVGKVVAMKLITDLPELGQLDNKAIAALVGVAPMTNESGKHKGRSMTRYGRRTVRKAIYMSALVATRYNQTMEVFYKRLLSKGKSKKVALVAVMRKMIIILNVMVKNNADFKLDF